jgi:hypothetical protein
MGFSVRKEFILTFLAAVVVYIIWLTYYFSMLEIRLGKIEHFLAHQGFFESHCHK